MAYSPTTWTTGDTISASALNKIEQGIADGGAGGLVVNVTNSGGTFTMDKTYAEIYETMKAGTPCFMCFTGSAYVPPEDIDSGYVHGVVLVEIGMCYKYDTVYRVYAPISYQSIVSSTSYLATPAVYVFQASSSDDYPTFYRTVYADPANCTATPSFIV